MNKKFTKQLDALETLSSLDFINQTTQVGLLIQQPVYPVSYTHLTLPTILLV